MTLNLNKIYNYILYSLALLFFFIIINNLFKEKVIVEGFNINKHFKGIKTGVFNKVTYVSQNTKSIIFTIKSVVSAACKGAIDELHKDEHGVKPILTSIKKITNIFKP